MIASLAAVGLAPGLGSTGGGSGSGGSNDDDAPVPVETPSGLLTFDSAERTIDPERGYLASIMTNGGEIVVELNPQAPQAANSLAFLAGQNFYDGLEFFWVLPGFDAQTGDPTCAQSEELTCTGIGGPGYTLPLEGQPDTAPGRWSVIAPTVFPGAEEVHGSQLVFTMAEEGGFEGSVIGTVVVGQSILESLSERVPCFGAEPTESNPCQTEDELDRNEALVIQDVVVEPA